jgi:hypothetical protein
MISTKKMVLKQNNRVKRFTLCVTQEFESSLESKAKAYCIPKHTLASLCEFVGFFALMKIEEQIDSIGGKYDTKEIIKRISCEQDIGAFNWAWSIKDLLKPAIKKMSVEEVFLIGLKSIKTKEVKSGGDYLKIDPEEIE